MLKCCGGRDKTKKVLKKLAQAHKMRRKKCTENWPRLTIKLWTTVCVNGTLMLCRQKLENLSEAGFGLAKKLWMTIC